MLKGSFVFLTDKYFTDFAAQDPTGHGLMKNKVSVAGKPTSRPFFYVNDVQNNICWVIPVSTQVDKYHEIYNGKVARNGRCDTLAFGDVLGKENAFLIQNMCPVTPEYIESVYTVNGRMVGIAPTLQAEISKKAGTVLALQKAGKPVIFNDALAIEKTLMQKDLQSSLDTLTAISKVRQGKAGADTLKWRQFNSGGERFEILDYYKKGAREFGVLKNVLSGEVIVGKDFPQNNQLKWSSAKSFGAGAEAVAAAVSAVKQNIMN